MKYLSILVFALLFLSYSNVSGQGCSDAGFCSVGILKPLSSDSTQLNKQELSLFLANGIGDEGVYIFTPAIQYENKINKHLTFQGRVSGNYASGNLGNTIGLGDLTVSISYTLPSKSNWTKSILLGTKIPLNSGNLLYEGKPLPMIYQSSLGTLDLIAGFSVTNFRWLFSAGLQQPLTGSNKNTFLSTKYNNDEAKRYPQSYSFNRKGDVLLRVGYNIITKNKLKLNAGLLGICHLKKDTYEDVNISSEPIAINGSEGLTLNATAALRFKLNKKISVGITGGIPLIVREIRPDGLTRSFVFAPELNVDL